MKYFEIKSQSCMIFNVGVNEELKIRNGDSSPDYVDTLEITSLSVDEIEVPKNKLGKLFLCRFLYSDKGANKLLISIQYDAAEFIKKLKSLKNYDDCLLIVCSQELIEYYENVYLQAKATKNAELKAEWDAIIQAAFDKLQGNDILEIRYHTSDGYKVPGEAGKHGFFKNGFSEMKKAKVSIDDRFVAESGWDDYSFGYTYKITFAELKDLYQAARGILEPIEMAAAEEKAAQEAKEAALKAAVKCEIIEQGETQGERLDPFAHVRMTNVKTGETLEYTCRNVFDFGYVVNPNYAIAEGLKPGGLTSGDKWMDFKSGEGWYDVREQTEFEKLCLEYLHTFPPINSGIRM